MEEKNAFAFHWFQKADEPKIAFKISIVCFFLKTCQNRVQID